MAFPRVNPIRKTKAPARRPEPTAPSSELFSDEGNRPVTLGMRAVRNMGVIALLTLVLAPLQLLAIRQGWALRAKLPLVFHRTALRLIGVHVRRVGAPAPEGPVLFVANHISWLDISVLGSILEGCFIAKREVGEWAGFGTLARLQRTVFVDRAQRSRTQAQNEEIGERLGEGDNLILFAEGTSSDGTRVLAFKSALFGAAESVAGAGHGEGESGITVQPVTIAYTRVNGIPLTRTTRPKIGWYGDMAMMPHFSDVLGLGRISVDVRFHEPVDSRAYASRKTLAAHCEREVRRGLVASKREAMAEGHSRKPSRPRRKGARRRFSRKRASDI